MAKPPHIIQKLKFDVELDKEENYHSLADRLSSLVRYRLQNLIEEALKDVGESWLLYRFGRLEINLGEIDDSDIEQILRNEVPRKLRALLLDKIQSNIDFEKKPIISTTNEFREVAHLTMPKIGAMVNDKKALEEYLEARTQKETEDLSDAQILQKTSPLTDLPPREILEKRLQAIESKTVKTSIPITEDTLKSPSIPTKEQTEIPSEKPKKEAIESSQKSIQLQKKTDALPLTTSIESKNQPLYISIEKGEEVAILANYSNQIDALVWFLKRGRLPHWIHLGERTIQELMTELSKNYPQLLFGRLSRLVRQEVGVLPRLLMQFEGEISEKIQHYLKEDLGEEYDILTSKLSRIQTEKPEPLPTNELELTEDNPEDFEEKTESSVQKPAIPQNVIDAVEEIESIFRTTQKSEAQFEFSELRIAFLTHIILYGEPPFWGASFPKMSYDKMVLEDLKSFANRFQKILFEYPQNSIIDNILTHFSTDILSHVFQIITPDFFIFIQTKINQFRKETNFLKLSESKESSSHSSKTSPHERQFGMHSKEVWRLILKYFFRTKKQATDVAFADFFSDLLIELSIIIGIKKEQVSLALTENLEIIIDSEHSKSDALEKRKKPREETENALKTRLPESLVKAIEKTESSFQSIQKTEDIFSIPSLQITFLTQFILEGKTPILGEYLPKISPERMALESLPNFAKRFKAILNKHSDERLIDTIFSIFSIKLIARMMEIIEPFFAKFIQIKIGALKESGVLSNVEKEVWKMVLKYLFKTKDFNTETFFIYFLIELSKITNLNQTELSAIFEPSKTHFIKEKPTSELLELSKETNQKQEKSEPILTISELRVAFLTHIILFNEVPFWSAHLPKMPYDKMVLESGDGFIERLRKLIHEHPERLLIDSIISNFEAKIWHYLVQKLEPDFVGFIQTLVKALKKWVIVSNSERLAWKLVFKYIFRKTTFNINEFLATFLAELSKEINWTPSDITQKLIQISENAAQSGEKRFNALKTMLELGKNAVPLPNPEIEKSTMPEYDILVLLEYFLNHGRLPADAKAVKSDFEQKLLELIANRSKTVIDIFRKIARNQILSNRALGSLSDSIFELLIKKLMPIRGAALIQDFKIMRQLPESDFVGLHALIYALNIKEEKFSTAHYLSDFVKALVRKNITDPKKLIDNILKNLESIKEKTGAKELIKTLQVLQKAVKTSKSLGHQTALKSLQKETPRPTERISVPYKFRDGELLEPIYIRNAGTVLLWPFLGHYFKRLEMLTPEKKWKNEEVANRAVHLIQYLGTTQPAAEEHELVLNKLLCGIPIETPIQYGITITEAEKELSESLLRAAIGNWKAIGKATPDGLRGSFLIRSGRLVKKEERKWVLTVEKKPYDILLGKLPWTFSMIKASWMDCVILVEWV